MLVVAGHLLLLAHSGILLSEAKSRGKELALSVEQPKRLAGKATKKKALDGCAVTVRCRLGTMLLSLPAVLLQPQKV